MKLIHSNSKIFFKNPYVVVLEYGADTPDDAAQRDYSKIVRHTYKTIQGTWGHSKLKYETSSVVDHPLTTPYPNINGQMVLRYQDYTVLNRGYFCFKEEVDALQFRLYVGSKGKHVFMWPRIEFTIHEVVQDEPTITDIIT